MSRIERSMATSARDTILLYYHYVDIDCLEDSIKMQEDWCVELELFGRIRVSPEGLNGTIDGCKSNILTYIDRMNGHYVDSQQETGNGKSLKTIDWKIAFYPNQCKRRFDKISIKKSKEVVSLDITDEEVVRKVKEMGPGKYVSAQEFHEELSNPSENLLLLDVRNYYETRIGRMEYEIQKNTSIANTDDNNDVYNGMSFEKVRPIDPMTRSFSDFKFFADTHVEKWKNKKILMYCTGGVRCELASAYLKYKGVDDVNHLYGGIQRYLEAFPPDETKSFFKGRNFVFDPRVSVRPEKDSLNDSNQEQLSHDPESPIDPTPTSKNATTTSTCCCLFTFFSLVTPSIKQSSTNVNLKSSYRAEVGKCLKCAFPFDNYASPYGAKQDQIRCPKCRVLVLVCDNCILIDKEASVNTLCELCVQKERDSSR